MRSKEEILEKYLSNLRLQYRIIQEYRDKELDEFARQIYYELRGGQSTLEYILNGDEDEIDWENFHWRVINGQHIFDKLYNIFTKFYWWLDCWIFNCLSKKEKRQK
jgi:hypothetical protein